MLDLYGSTWNTMSEDIKGYSFDDNETQSSMQRAYQTYGYVIDPHGAVGLLALDKYQVENKGTIGIVLETAHPSKFLHDVERILDKKIEVPDRLAVLADKQKESVLLGVEFAPFKKWLQSKF
jgi:threonine synthase